MLAVHLDPYHTRRPDGRPLDFTVSLDDEGAISVTIDVDPREVWTSYKRPHDEVEEVLEAWPDGISVETFDGATQDSKRARSMQLLADEVRRLREQVASAVDSFELHPEPGEARAIAAALVHHADEVDRLFGRRI